MNDHHMLGRLAWLTNRLRCMSPAEVLYRLGQGYAKRRERQRHVHARMQVPTPPFASDWLLHPDLADIPPEPYLEEADAIAGGSIVLFNGRRFDVGSSPDWNRDPLTGIRGPRSYAPDIPITRRSLVGDIRHVWELNRHQHLVRLAQAFVLSGKKEYLCELGRHIGAWLEQCPPLIGPNWTNALEMGIRLVNWSVIWNLIGGAASELFREDGGERLRRRWLDSIHAHCLYIGNHFSRYSSANNHLIGELTGMFVAARTWPLWEQSPLWMAQARTELEQQAMAQHFGDGVNREQAFSYQVFSTEFLLVAGLVGEKSGDPFSRDYWNAIERSLRFLLSVRDAGGHVPAIGDADDAAVLRLEPHGGPDRAAVVLAMGEAAFGRSRSLGRSRGRAGACPDTVRWLPGKTVVACAAMEDAGCTESTDWQFPEGGYFLFGSDFGSEREIKGMVDCGPLGYLGIAAHGHADALALTLSICGEECLIDPGTFSYWDDLKWRDYFRGTSAHNTVRIDGRDQSVGAGRFMWTRKAAASVTRRPSSPHQFEFVGFHDGYLRLADPVRHVRSVRYDDASRTLVVRDEITARRRHQVEQFWHLSPDLQVEQDKEVVIADRRFRLHVSFSGSPLSLQVIRGAEDPPLGWHSRAYGVKQPTTVIKATAHTTGAAAIETRFRIDIPASMH